MDLILGTPIYMAPELCREDADEYDLKVDVWSIGCITHLLLAGELPFDGDSVAEIKSSIVNDELKLEKLLAKKVSKEAIEFILKCLNKEANNRPLVKDLLEDPWIKFWVGKESEKMIDISEE